MSVTTAKEDAKKQGLGWLFIAMVILAFPALFFLCVFFPIWIGMTPRW